MKIKISQSKILSVIFLLLLSLPIELETMANQPQRSLTVLSSTKENITLEVNIPRYEKKTKLSHGKEMDILNIVGFAQTSIPGKPQLPVKGYLFGIPLDGVASVEILEAEFKIFSPINIFYTPKILPFDRLLVNYLLQ